MTVMTTAVMMRPSCRCWYPASRSMLLTHEWCSYHRTRGKEKEKKIQDEGEDPVIFKAALVQPRLNIWGSRY